MRHAWRSHVLAAAIPARYASDVLDLWSYKAGVKEQVGTIEKELRSPAAKLAIRCCDRCRTS